MMSNTQFLLGKLAEEAGELAQACIKAQQHGLDKVFGSNFPDSNKTLLENEYNDVIGIVHMLNAEELMGTQCIKKISAKSLEKQRKTDKWRKVAIAEGFTSPPTYVNNK